MRAHNTVRKRKPKYNRPQALRVLKMRPPFSGSNIGPTGFNLAQFQTLGSALPYFWSEKVLKFRPVEQNVFQTQSFAIDVASKLIPKMPRKEKPVQSGQNILL